MNSRNSVLYQCRLCLKRTSTKVNVLAGDFPKMLEILTSIKVRENDGLPKYSCTKCAQDVKAALILKKRIIKAHKTLLECIKKGKQILQERRVKEKFFIHNSTKTIDPGTVIKKEILSNVNTTVKTNLELESPNHVEFLNVSPIPEVSIKSENDDGSLKPSANDVTVEKKSSFQNIIDRLGDFVKPKGNLTCKICNLTFKEKSAYYTHSAKHKKTKCHICGTVVRTDNFKKHLIVHTSEPTICNVCGATCKNIESLRGHIFYQHKSSADAYVCEECGKHFRIKYKFELHKRKEHVGIRTFKCEICGKAFFTNGTLNSHINMTHKKLRPYVCEFCETGFSSSYALKTHKRQHTNEKPFKCEFCDEGFRQKVSLRSHLKSKHKVEESKDFVCEICERGFATNYALNIHARLHMAQKCEVCSETFADEKYLKNHLKEVHHIEEQVVTNDGYSTKAEQYCK